MQQWTQNEAIAFECACEAITDMMAFQSSQIADEESKRTPDAIRIRQLYAERSRLAQERASLRVDNQSQIAKIRAEYGALIRARRAKSRSVSR